MASDGESVVTFMSVTGANDAESRHYLEMANGDVDAAVNLFFNNAPGPGAAGGAGSSAPTQTTSAAAAEDAVRAPIPVKRDVLYEGSALGAAARMYARGGTREGEDDVPVPFRNFGNERCTTSDDGSGDALAALFQPPTELLFRGDFDGARAEASRLARWLIVNIQSHQEFASSQLNRDTWSDAVVKDTVRSGFVLWQTYERSESGRKFCAFYKADRLPMIAVIDPTTGCRAWSKTGFVEPQMLMEDLLPFLEAGPECLPQESDDAHPGSGVGNGNGNGQSTSEPSPPPQQVPQPKQNPDMATNQTKRRREEDAVGAIARVQEARTAAARDLPPEPEANAPDAISIMIRLGSGARKVRRFSRHAHQVAHLYNFVDASDEPGVPAPGAYRLVTTFPRRVLVPEPVPLQEAGFTSKQEALLLEEIFLDD